MANIAYLSPYFWPESIGSAPYCTDLAEWLAARGHKINAIAFRPHYPTVAEFGAWQDGSRDSEMHAGIHVSRIPARERGGGGFRGRILNDVRFLSGVALRALKAEFSATDVIVAYVPSSMCLIGAKLMGWRTGAPVIAIVHDIESGLASSLGIARNPLLLKIMRLVERFALNRAERVIVLTVGMASELRAIGCKRPIEVLPIWVSLPPTADPDLAAPFVVSYSGNFGKKQNLDQLLPLIELLDRRRPDIQVVLRGEGSERQRLEVALSSLRVRNTRFDALVPASELVSSLRASQLHLVPQAQNVSNYAVPSKLFSIMSVGRPFITIAPKGTTLAQLASDSGAGICVEPDDPEALFSAVDHFSSNRLLIREFGTRGRDFVRHNMEREQILSKYEHILINSIARGRS